MAHPPRYSSARMKAPTRTWNDIRDESDKGGITGVVDGETPVTKRVVCPESDSELEKEPLRSHGSIMPLRWVMNNKLSLS
ncbi:hypothetical protein BAUCODRAFT_32947 [Baudoinia panamericana UAMH 10762]|uniref:Uncharacterized protein n=1 Tax=Baudoinia panamericana (strain UAMH 10762) TaxID=717646 RepID=M2LRU9_BAUPA|nr:uncharacterized protein BAUCODRAFT_32947 [Baudoinia panamericana UAMH 10762]EMC97202.1 hypothetical protein BAUCODRAFT_32947 [Baudoinia panamericana UAMH 10762]